jgi:hypothetical protein
MAMATVALVMVGLQVVQALLIDGPAGLREVRGMCAVCSDRHYQHTDFVVPPSHLVCVMGGYG